MGAYFCLIGIAKPERSELLAALEAIEDVGRGSQMNCVLFMGGSWMTPTTIFASPSRGKKTPVPCTSARWFIAHDVAVIDLALFFVEPDADPKQHGTADDDD